MKEKLIKVFPCDDDTDEGIFEVIFNSFPIVNKEHIILILSLFIRDLFHQLLKPPMHSL